jgi:ASC-1-like (ASCH) protein
MPYRRLPNTDNARLKALKAAVKKGRELPPFKMAYAQSTFAKANLFVNSFEKSMVNYKAAYNKQIERNKEYQLIAKKARLYLSHFIQVLNMTISRGELPEMTRDLYGMDSDERKLPNLVADKDLLEWGIKIIKGEAERTAKGQPPITNPTIAVVKVRYENFVEAYNHQRILQQNTQRCQSDLDELRAKADSIILDVWNGVEDTFKNLPDHERREKALPYGLVYVYRKNEIRDLQLLGRSFVGIDV